MDQSCSLCYYFSVALLIIFITDPLHFFIKGLFMNEFTQSIYLNLTQVPFGQIISYGQLAKLAGYPNHSRHVGKTLSRLPEDTSLPWFRVVSSQGKISLSGDNFIRQRKALEKEGLTIRDDGKILNFKQVIMQ